MLNNNSDPEIDQTTFRRTFWWVLIIVLVLTGIFGPPVKGDELTITRNNKSVAMEGEIVVEAEDKSILFRSRDGRLWIVEGDKIESKIDDDKPIQPLTKKEIGEQILKELPAGFRIYETDNFVVAYQTEKAYARWVGGLYERLLKGFNKYWKKQKFVLHDAKYPLVAIIFGSRAQYAQFVQRDLGEDPGTMVAYYNLMTNRVAMYDLTADQKRAGELIKNDRRVTDILSGQNSIPMVATVIHEGTHQLMFNCGMQTRFSDTPLWLNEGMAMYFETPDLKSDAGWRGIGKVNPMRLNHFASDFQNRKPGALQSLLSSDERFKDPESNTLAYSESWAFNYFLLKKHSKNYVKYLKFMSEKKPLDYDTPEQRLKDFRQFMGDDIDNLDREFIQFLRKIN